MSAHFTVCDETPAGRTVQEFLLEFFNPALTVRELIELRVRTEVERFNRAANGEVFRGLVQPSDAELTLNGDRTRPPKLIDAEQQCKSALHAFEANGFLLIVGDRQVESLDERLTLDPEMRVAFVKLVPLVGG